MSGGYIWERVIDRVVNSDPYELFEWLFTGALNEIPNPNVVRPGEQCVGGIFCTPDGFNIDEEILEEYKATTKSSRHGIQDKRFYRWVGLQIPFYLKALRLTRCRLRVFYIKGDYTDGVPQWYEYILSYTQQEIDEVYDLIKINSDYMIANNLVDYEAT